MATVAHKDQTRIHGQGYWNKKKTKQKTGYLMDKDEFKGSQLDVAFANSFLQLVRNISLN